jgi:hypothetical protein
MKTLKAALLLALLSASAARADEASLANVHRGNFLIGTDIGGNVTQTFGPNSLGSTNIGARVPFQYFFWDRLAIGAVVGTAWSFGSGIDTTELTFGPVVTYFLEGSDKLRYFGSVSLVESWDFAWGSQFDNLSSSSGILGLAGGLQYFVAPNFAAGPSLQFRRPLGVNAGALSVGLTLGIYL